MEIEDPTTTFQEDQVPNVAICATPLVMEVEHGKENSQHANRDADYGSKDLFLFSK